MLEFIEILPGCPYHGFATSIDLTCEEGLCWWIRQPVNVISSLAHLIVAIYIYRIGELIHSRAHRDIGIIATFVSFASMGAHATHLKFFGTMDFTLQYLFMAHFIYVNASRIGRRPPFGHWSFSLFLFFFLTIIQSIEPQVSTILYAIMLFTMLSIEGLCFFNRKESSENLSQRQKTEAQREVYIENTVTSKKQRASDAVKGSQRSYAPLAKAAALFGAGLICFLLDSERIVCDPNNHWFQMHAVWHLLTAWSLIFLAKFYHQFDEHF